MRDLDVLEESAPGTRAGRARLPWFEQIFRRAGFALSGEPWRSVLGGVVACLLIGTAYWLFAPRTYRAQAVVAPSTRQNLTRLPSALSGLAGQLGINAEADPTTTPAFYSLLGSSESIRREVLFSHLPPRPGEAQGHLVWSALGIERCDSLCILRKGLRKLDEDVDVVIDRQTGTFDVAATLRNPFDAAGVVGLYVQAMDRFNREVRQSQAKAVREFLETRVAQATAGLQSAEDALQTFYEHNARWQTSPRLVVEEGRLRRTIDMRTELRSSLVRQLEAARLDEVNSTPLLSVIDSATPPLRKHSPRGLPILLAAVVTGGLLGLAVGLARVQS